MSKLNLIRLTKDEITKEEAQKSKGGLTGCPCPCSCGCFCSYDPSELQYRPDTDWVKLEDKMPVLEKNNP
jgi:hypothetical protein